LKEEEDGDIEKNLIVLGEEHGGGFAEALLIY